jgi:two-component system response regulator
MTYAAPADHTIDILLVEDNPGDIRLTQEALKSAKVEGRLHSVRDGEAAIEFLWRKGVHKNAPRPHIVLLDLNLHKKNGSDVLHEIKSDQGLRSIPVIILTTSSDPDDISRAYSLYANCYVRKPMELESFHDVVHKIDEFWLSIARLPEV